MMDQLSIGMVVDICRSDGRTHSAVVSKIRRENWMVDVEWFEAVRFILIFDQNFHTQIAIFN